MLAVCLCRIKLLFILAVSSADVTEEECHLSELTRMQVESPLILTPAIIDIHMSYDSQYAIDLSSVGDSFVGKKNPHRGDPPSSQFVSTILCVNKFYEHSGKSLGRLHMA